MKLLKYLKDKDYRAYCKMERRHRRKLVKLAKKIKPYDYCFFHDFVVAMIEFYSEYYDKGNNIWQTDETRIPIVESLKGLIELNKTFETSAGLVVNDQAAVAFYKEFYKTIGEDICLWWD